MLHRVSCAVWTRDVLGAVAARRALGRLTDFTYKLHTDRVDTWCCFQKGLDFQANAVELIVCVKHFRVVNEDCGDRIWRVGMSKKFTGLSKASPATQVMISASYNRLTYAHANKLDMIFCHHVRRCGKIPFVSPVRQRDPTQQIRVVPVERFINDSCLEQVRVYKARYCGRHLAHCAIL